MTIGQIANRTGLAPSAIRYYETQGLISPIRNSTGQRRYLRGDLRRLSFVMICQQLGYSLGQISEALASLPKGRNPTKEDWTTLSTNFRAELDAKITTLQSLRDRLDGCIGCGCLSLKSCSLYNHKDNAAAKGNGPRYLMGDAAPQ
jgi:MerR family redox-sensitive transcriptional activator SoxR